jgi:hypothetical protein
MSKYLGSTLEEAAAAASTCAVTLLPAAPEAPSATSSANCCQLAARGRGGVLWRSTARTSTLRARLTIKLDRLIVLSKSSLLGWFLHVSLIVIIKGSV